jgi:hypothetical protein
MLVPLVVTKRFLQIKYQAAAKLAFLVLGYYSAKTYDFAGR